MPHYVVYEVWTRSHLVEAATEEAAYDISDPQTHAIEPHGLNLCNWHVVPITPIVVSPSADTGA